MPIFDDEYGFPVPTWTTDDVTVLEAIDDSLSVGISRLLGFVIREQGLVDDATLDLILVFHSVISGTDEKYSFDDAERVVTVASEFCLIDCVYDNQVLSMVELRDNAVLYLALQDEHTLALEAAVCLSKNDRSLLSTSATRPSLALFGQWEDLAATILSVMLTNGQMSDSIGSLMNNVVKEGVYVQSEVEFVDLLRKLTAVGLFSVSISRKDRAVVSIESQAAGLFLLFSGRSDLARRLAEISI